MRIVQTIALLLLLAGCATAEDAGRAAPDQTRDLQIPPALQFAELRLAPPRETAAYSTADRLRTGAEFVASLPYANVSISGEALSFEPASAGKAPTNIAYAIYEFLLPEFLDESTISIPPEFWVGISNWETNRWDWGRSDETNLWRIGHGPGALAPYRDEHGRILVLVVLAGNQSQELQELGIGTSTWVHTFGSEVGPQEWYPGGMALTKDNGVVVLGEYPLGSPSVLIKYDHGGRLLWHRAFSDLRGNLVGYDYEQDRIIVIGVSGLVEISWYSFSADGLPLEQRAFELGGLGNDVYLEVITDGQVTEDGQSYLAILASDWSQQERRVAVVTKIDANGSLSFARKYDQLDFNSFGILADSDHVYLSGWHNLGEEENYKDAAFLASFDTDGTHNWTRAWTSEDGSARLLGSPAIENGNICAVGELELNPPGDSLSLFLSWSPDGNFSLSRCYSQETPIGTFFGLVQKGTALATMASLPDPDFGQELLVEIVLNPNGLLSSTRCLKRLSNARTHTAYSKVMLGDDLGNQYYLGTAGVFEGPAFEMIESYPVEVAGESTELSDKWIALFESGHHTPPAPVQVSFEAAEDILPQDDDWLLGILKNQP